MSQAVIAATIPGTGSITAGTPLAAPALGAISIPSNFTGTQISFSASTDGGATYSNIYYQGNEVIVSVTAGTVANLNSSLWSGVTNVKVRAGTSASPVVQSSDVQFGLIGYFSGAPVPNRTAVGRVKVPARPVAMRDYSTVETGVRTLDLALVLDTGNGVDAAETLVSVDSVALSVLGPVGAADAAPASRILSAAGIEGTLISVECGGWDQTVPLIQYLATIEYTTSRLAGNAVFGTFFVRQPGVQ